MPELREYLAELVLAGLAGRAPRPLPEGLTVEALISAARERQMVYLLLNPLLRLDLPQQESGRLRAMVLCSVLKSRTQLHSIAEIERALEDAGIRHLFLKGASLKGLYPVPECREMSDIDLMVYGDTVQQAGRLLEQLGYRLHKSAGHHDIYVKPPYLVVELHWTLYSHSVDAVQADYYEQFSALRRKDGFSCAYAFSDEDFYVYMVSHIARHFYETGCGIRNLVDIHVYTRALWHRLDHAYIGRQLKACGLVRFEENIRQLAGAWLGDGCWKEHFNVFFEYMYSCGTYGRDENGIWGRLSQYQELNRNAYHKTLRRWYYFPPYSYMVEDYPWLKKRRWLLPWAWVVRAVLGKVRRKGRSKLQLLKQVDDTQVASMHKLYGKMGLDFHKKDGAQHQKHTRQQG